MSVTKRVVRRLEVVLDLQALALLARQHGPAQLDRVAHHGRALGQAAEHACRARPWPGASPTRIGVGAAGGTTTTTSSGFATVALTCTRQTPALFAITHWSWLRRSRDGVRALVVDLEVERLGLRLFALAEAGAAAGEGEPAELRAHQVGRRARAGRRSGSGRPCRSCVWREIVCSCGSSPSASTSRFAAAPGFDGCEMRPSITAASARAAQASSASAASAARAGIALTSPRGPPRRGLPNGHSSNVLPNTNTNPPIQIQFTSGFT